MFKILCFLLCSCIWGTKSYAHYRRDETNPTNTYGETKLIMEKMMKWCDQAYGIKYVALRYFNVAGQEKQLKLVRTIHPETHLIPLILQVALGQREQITIFGEDYDTSDGTCIRDYVHVEDLIAAHILALEYFHNGGENNIFNLGSSKGYSVKEMVDAARQVTNHSIPSKLENAERVIQLL